MKKLSVLYTPLSPAASFVLDGIMMEDVEIVPLQIRNIFIYKILFQIFIYLRFYKLAAYFRFSYSTYNKLHDLSDNVLYFDCCKPDEYCVVDSLANSSRKSIFFWNPLDNWSHNSVFIREKILKLKKKGFNLFSFDPSDCAKYKLSLIKNVNRKVSMNYTNNYSQDFYFIGKSKGREHELMNLKKELEKKGYKTKFMIINNRIDYISLYDSLLNSNESICIVDWIAPNQTGLSLRPFDALFLKKKLITNCKDILKYDFYRPSNIFVVENSLNGIDEFIRSPLEDIPDEIVLQYEINNWLKKNFININLDY